MNARVIDHSTDEIVEYSQQELLVADKDMAISSAIASQVAASHTFNDYLSDKPNNTILAQLIDLGAFCDYLLEVGVTRTAEELQTIPNKWAGIEWGQVKGFVKWLLKNGYSIATVNRRLSTVKVYCKLAKQAGAISTDTYLRIKDVTGYKPSSARNIDEKREVTRVGHKKAEPVHISDEQAEQLKRQPDTPQGRRDRLLMCLLLDHGLRAGELSGLMVGDLNLNTGVMRFDRPKVSKEQNHKLSADTLRALRAYIDSGDRPAEGYLLRGSRKGGKLDGNGMNEIAITVRVKELAERIGLQGMSAHDCRHYWATKWAGKVDVFRLQEAGGWSSLEMPRRYVARAEVANEGMV
jgi:integrase